MKIKCTKCGREFNFIINKQEIKKYTEEYVCRFCRVKEFKQAKQNRMGQMNGIASEIKTEKGIRGKRMTKEKLNQLFELLYELDEHCEFYLEGKSNEFAAMKAIQVLNENGFVEVK